MRFMGDPNLNGAQENLFGNYIIQKGLSNPQLRDEILAEVANQVRLLQLPLELNGKKQHYFCNSYFLIFLVRCGEILTF